MGVFDVVNFIRAQVVNFWLAPKPHGGNLFQEKVPGAVFVGNGFGKLMGSTQVNELGEIESPILLTSTLNVPRVADAALDYLLGLPGNEPKNGN
jgi:D-aminopeptidase